MNMDVGRAILEQRAVLTATSELCMAHNRAVTLSIATTYPNRDFVFRFSRINAAHDFSIATNYDSPNAIGHFALNMFPDTTLTSGNRPNLEIVLLVDISGSQGGWPLAKEKEVCNAILDRLLPTDRLCVLAFSDNVYWCFGNQTPVDASADNIAIARTWINGQQVLGGTQLLAGIQAALSVATTSEHSRYYVFLTDGFITNEEAIYDELRNHPSKPTVFTFGAGNSLNRYFLDQTAAIGNGYATEITQYESVAPKVDLAWDKFESPQVRNLSVSFGNASVSEIIMPLGSNLYRGSPVTVYGKYRNGGLQTVTINGYREGQPVSWTRDISFASSNNLNSMVPKVWAKNKIEQLVIAEGATTANKDSIIAISTAYQVLSKYTAFLAFQPTAISDDQRQVLYATYGVATDVQRSPAVADATSQRMTLRITVKPNLIRVALPQGMVAETLEIIDLQGRIIFTIRLGAGAKVNEVVWDGRLSNGKRLTAGSYIVRVKTNHRIMVASFLWR